MDAPLDCYAPTDIYLFFSSTYTPRVSDVDRNRALEKLQNETASRSPRRIPLLGVIVQINDVMSFYNDVIKLLKDIQQYTYAYI